LKATASFSTPAFAGPQQKQIISPGLFVTLRAPDDATVRVSTKQGEFSFRLGDIAFGQPKLFLDGRVRVERTPASFRLTAQPQKKTSLPLSPMLVAMCGWCRSFTRMAVNPTWARR
jgi:hypothetical protein